MPNNAAPLFREIEPPQGLVPAILVRIARARQNAARLRMAAFGTVALVSLVTLVPVFQYAATEFSTSGFVQYASLFFDSFSRGYWQEILYSLGDSLPSFALLLLAAIISIGASSLWYASRNARIAFTRVALGT
ncbi:MAG: hypothetical protein WAN50_01805 [Minisyncoccia bacterium]